MTAKLRVLALVSIVFLIAAACSKPKTQVAQSGGEQKGASALSANAPAPEKNNAGVLYGKGGAAKGAAAPQGYASLNPTADLAQTSRLAKLIRPQSTNYPNGNPNTWTGVTKSTVKLTFNIDKTNCGVNLINAINQAGGNLPTSDRYFRPNPPDNATANAERDEAIALLIRYWNDHAQELYANATHLTDVMKKFNTVGHPFYGRKLIYDTVDGGSFQPGCQEKTTAAAVEVAQHLHPFSVVTDDVPSINGSGYNMSAALNAKAPASSRPMHFGFISPSDKWLKQWAPYVWTQFQSGTRNMQFSAQLLCSRFVGGKATAQFNNGQTRKFGLLYPNNTNAKQLASEFKDYVKQYCGDKVSFSTSGLGNEVAFTDDPARATDEGGQIAVKFRAAGVTTVIYVYDIVDPLFHIVGFKGQNYKPEFFWTSTYQDTSTVQRLYQQDMVDKVSYGINPFAIQGFGFGAGDAFWIYHTYHQKSSDGQTCDTSSNAGMNHPGCKAPGEIVTLYYSYLPLVTGLLFAGPNATPNIVTSALQAYPLTRYGTDGPTTDPQAVLVGAGPGQYYFITDASWFKWRASFVSPPVEQKLGWAEWPDCQRRYLSFLPEKLTDDWAKTSKNYNFYCGNAKYAPSPYTPTDKKCSDAPSGVCEKDDYPRWFPHK